MFFQVEFKEVYDSPGGVSLKPVSSPQELSAETEERWKSFFHHETVTHVQISIIMHFCL